MFRGVIANSKVVATTSSIGLGIAGAAMPFLAMAEEEAKD